jgi:DNA-binding MarR family transcriptional regulator
MADMRPPRRSQNTVQTPLNAILGTEANLRLLRVLSRTETPMTAGELARRAQLGRTSVYPALEALESTGIVEFIGAGVRRQLRFRSEHPLGRALVDLFNAEAQRTTALVGALRESFAAISPRPSAAWLEGLNDELGGEESLSLWVVADPRSLPQLADALTDRISDVERRFGVQIAVSGLTRSEIERRASVEPERLAQVVPLDGVPPMALVTPAGKHSSSETLRSHGEHDTRARRLAIAVAAKLKRDPTLVQRARARIAEREKHASSGERRALREWLRMLDTAPGKLERILTDRSERATRLRQTLPALDLLTPSERNAVLSSETDEEARAAVGRTKRR